MEAKNAVWHLSLEVKIPQNYENRSKCKSVEKKGLNQVKLSMLLTMIVLQSVYCPNATVMYRNIIR